MRDGIGCDVGNLPATLLDARHVGLERIREQCKALPGYAAVRRATFTLEPWTVENGLLTPTLKLKRAKVMEKFNAEIDHMYAGH